MYRDKLLVANTNHSTDGGFYANIVARMKDRRFSIGGATVYRGVSSEVVIPAKSGPVLFYYENDGTKIFLTSSHQLYGLWMGKEARLIDSNVLGAFVSGVNVYYVSRGVREKSDSPPKDDECFTVNTDIESFFRECELPDPRSPCYLSEAVLSCEPRNIGGFHITGDLLDRPVERVEVGSGQIFVHLCAEEDDEFGTYYRDDRVCTQGWLRVPKNLAADFTKGNVLFLDPERSKWKDHLAVREGDSYQHYTLELDGTFYGLVKNRIRHSVKGWVVDEVFPCLYEVDSSIFSGKIKEYQYNQSSHPEKIPSSLITSSLHSYDKMIVDSDAHWLYYYCVYLAEHGVKSCREENGIYSYKTLRGNNIKVSVHRKSLSTQFRLTPYGILACTSSVQRFNFRLYTQCWTDRKKNMIDSGTSINFTVPEECVTYLTTWRYVAGSNGEYFWFYDLSNPYFSTSRKGSLGVKLPVRFENCSDPLPAVLYGEYPGLDALVHMEHAFYAHFEEENRLDVTFYPGMGIGRVLRDIINHYYSRTVIIDPALVHYGESSQEYMRKKELGLTQILTPSEKVEYSQQIYLMLFNQIVNYFFVVNEHGYPVWNNREDLIPELVDTKYHRKPRTKTIFAVTFAKLIGAYIWCVNRCLPIFLPACLIASLINREPTLSELEFFCKEEHVREAYSESNPAKYMKKILGISTPKKDHLLGFAEQLQELTVFCFEKHSLPQINRFLSGPTEIDRHLLVDNILICDEKTPRFGVQKESDRVASLKRKICHFIYHLPERALSLLVRIWSNHLQVSNTNYYMIVMDTTQWETEEGIPLRAFENPDIFWNYYDQKSGDPAVSLSFGEPIVKPFKIRSTPGLLPGRDRNLGIDYRVAEDLDILQNLLMHKTDKEKYPLSEKALPFDLRR